MTIEYERQELRALALMPIRQLPDYVDDYTVNCRVGKAVSVHAARTPWDGVMQMALEASLNRCYAAKRPRGTTLATETNIAIWYQYNAELSAKLANDATDPAERAQHTDDESAWLKIAKEQFVRAAKFFK